MLPAENPTIIHIPPSQRRQQQGVEPGDEPFGDVGEVEHWEAVGCYSSSSSRSSL